MLQGGMESPYHWEQARAAAESADIILCLGTSLKVLRKYACLWCMDRPKKSRPPIFIVNLQWTPKDDIAELKIHGERLYYLSSIYVFSNRVWDVCKIDHFILNGWDIVGDAGWGWTVFYVFRISQWIYCTDSGFYCLIQSKNLSLGTIRDNSYTHSNENCLTITHLQF